MKRLADQRVDHFFDFGRDDVAAREFGVVENLADQPLGEQVLDEHLIDGRLADVRIQGRLAEREEIGEGLLELAIVGVGLLDLIGKREGQFRHPLLKLIDRLLEALDVGLGVGVERVEQIGDGLRVGQIDVDRDLAVLEKDGAAGVFEDRVAERVALGPLLADFDAEIVVGVFGFPVAALKIENIPQRAVGNDRFAFDAERLLGNEEPTVGFGRFR